MSNSKGRSELENSYQYARLSASLLSGSPQRNSCVTFALSNEQHRGIREGPVNSAVRTRDSETGTLLPLYSNATTTPYHKLQHIRNSSIAGAFDIYSTPLSKRHHSAPTQGSSGSQRSDDDVLPILNRKSSPQTRYKRFGAARKPSHLSGSKSNSSSSSSRSNNSSNKGGKTGAGSTHAAGSHRRKRPISPESVTALTRSHRIHRQDMEAQWLQEWETIQRRFKQDGFDVVVRQLTAMSTALEDTQRACQHRLDFASHVVMYVFSSMRALLCMMHDRSEAILARTMIKVSTPHTLAEQSSHSEGALVEGLARVGAQVQSKQAIRSALANKRLGQAGQDDGVTAEDALGWQRYGDDPFEAVVTLDDHTRSAVQARTVRQETRHLMRGILQQFHLPKYLLRSGDAAATDMCGSHNHTSCVKAADSTETLALYSNGTACGTTPSSDDVLGKYFLDEDDNDAPGSTNKDALEEEQCGNTLNQSSSLLSRITRYFESSISSVAHTIAQFAREYDKLSATATGQQTALHNNAQCVELARSTLQDTVANAESSAYFVLDKYHQISTELRSRMHTVEDGMAHSLSELLAALSDLCVSADSHFVEQLTPTALAILVERKEAIARKYCSAHERYARDVSDGLCTIQRTVQQVWEKHRCAGDAKCHALPPTHAEVLHKMCSRDSLVQLIYTLCANGSETMACVMHWIDEHVARQASLQAHERGDGRCMADWHRTGTASGHRSDGAARWRRLTGPQDRSDAKNEDRAFFSPAVPVPQAVQDYVARAEEKAAEMHTESHMSAQEERRKDSEREASARATSPARRHSALLRTMDSHDSENADSLAVTSKHEVYSTARKELTPCPPALRPLVHALDSSAIMSDIPTKDYHFWIAGSGCATQSVLSDKSHFPLSTSSSVPASAPSHETIHQLKPPPPSVPPRTRLIQQTLLALT